MRFEVDNVGPGEANLGFSRKLAAILIGGVVVLIAVTGATALWVSGQHTDLARESAERMVQGGFSVLEAKARTVARDHALWTEAYDAIRRDDVDWVYRNVGVGVAKSGTADLIVIVPPGARRAYGWTTGSDEEPQTGLLPPGVIASALRLVGPQPADPAVPVTFYAEVRGTLWLIGASRVLPSGGMPPGTADRDVPRQIFGFRIHGDLVAKIAAQHMIYGTSVGTAPLEGSDNLALLGADGRPAGYVNWAPPEPGMDILGRIALPLGLALALLALVAALASRHLMRSAQGLERALEANRRKTEFLANATHELRTPMHGVIGIARLLEQSGLDKRQREMLKVLTTAAVEQMDLIEDLLDVSQIDSGMRDIARTPFHPARIVTEVLGVVAPEALRKGLELRSDLAGGEAIMVLGDGDAFRRIVTNLVGNAVKFTDEGHVAVSLAGSVRRDAARLTLRVEDTGPGIDPAEHDRIFERFARSDQPATRKVGGNGLGLAITKSLVELMGGEIGLTSAPGEGATFSVAITFEIAGEPEDERHAA